MGFLADIIFEDYKITLTYGEHKFKLNVYDIKAPLCDIHNINFVTKMLYVIPSTVPLRGAIFYRLGIFKYQRLSWKSCAPPLVFPSGSFVARIMT